MTLQSSCVEIGTGVRGGVEARGRVAARTTRPHDQGRRPCFRAATPVFEEPSWPSSLHVVLPLLVVELALLLGGRVLVLLVLRHEVVHVRLRFGELHLVHALTSVP